MLDRWGISAKPRSPRRRSERSRSLRVRLLMSSSRHPAGLFDRDVDADTCSFVPGVMTGILQGSTLVGAPVSRPQPSLTPTTRGDHLPPANSPQNTRSRAARRPRLSAQADAIRRIFAQVVAVGPLPCMTIRCQRPRCLHMTRPVCLFTFRHACRGRLAGVAGESPALATHVMRAVADDSPGHHLPATLFSRSRSARYFRCQVAAVGLSQCGERAGRDLAAPVG
jgi:hypothetical protein